MSQGRDVVLVRDDVTLRGTVVGTGPAVLLLHAGAERRTVWAPIATALAARGLRTIAYDLRGHGESSGRCTALRPLADPVVARRVAGLVLVDVVPDPDPDRMRAWLDGQGLLDAHREPVDDVLRHGPELLAVATAIGAPTLLVRGGPRSPLLDDDVERFRAAVPTAALARVPTAGHLVARDAPDALAHVLAEHVSAWLAPGRTPSSGESARPEP